MWEGGGGGGDGGGEVTELKLWGIGSTWRQLPTIKCKKYILQVDGN